MNHSLKEKNGFPICKLSFAYIYALCLTFGNSFYSICVRLVEFSSAKILKCKSPLANLFFKQIRVLRKCVPCRKAHTSCQRD